MSGGFKRPVLGSTVEASELASDVDYSAISANDASTNITGAELEELSDGSDTSLHTHSGAGGQTIYDAIVAPSGGDYTTIESALDAGMKTIFVRDGNYTSSGAKTWATDEIVIVGESWDTIITMGAHKYTFSGSRNRFTNLQIKMGNTSSEFDCITGEQVTFDHVWFNFDAYGALAFNVSQAMWTVQNCYIDGLGISSGVSNTVMELGGAGGTFANNYCEIRDADAVGEDGFISTGTRSTITGNRFEMPFAVDSLLLEISSLSVVSGNTFEGADSNAVGFIAVGGDQNTISNNVFQGTTSIAVWFANGSNYNSVVGNVFELVNTTTSICIGAKDTATWGDITITGNSFMRAWKGIASTQLDNAIISGNHFASFMVIPMSFGTTTSGINVRGNFGLGIEVDTQGVNVPIALDVEHDIATLVSAGTVANRAFSGIELNTSATANSSVASAYHYTSDTGYDQDMTGRVITQRMTVSANGQVDLYFFTDNQSDPESATNYCGFRVNASAGTDTVYAVSKDGTTEETTDVTASFGSTNGYDYKVLDVVYIAGVSVTFFVNGTQVAYHTTNIMDNTDTTTALYGFVAYCDNGADSEAGLIYVDSAQLRIGL